MCSEVDALTIKKLYYANEMLNQLDTGTVTKLQFKLNLEWLLNSQQS